MTHFSRLRCSLEGENKANVQNPKKKKKIQKVSVPNPLGSLEHLLEVDNPWVVDVLQDGHLVLQLSLLLRREAQLVNHLDGHRTRARSVHPWTGERHSFTH